MKDSNASYQHLDQEAEGGKQCSRKTRQDTDVITVFSPGTLFGSFQASKGYPLYD